MKDKEARIEPPSVFISYCHEDRDSVWPLASHLGRIGFRVWMDTKDLEPGASIIEHLSTAIERSDLYLVALSASALASRWVAHELNTALTLEITKGRPLVLPIMLSKVDPPVAIRSRLYVDLSGASLEDSRVRIEAALRERLPTLRLAKTVQLGKEVRFGLAEVVMELREETHKCYGGLAENHSHEEVDAEAEDIAGSLRRRAHGVLLNFVAASDMDFTSPQPRFPNGEVATAFRDVGGHFVGSTSREAIVSVRVLNPDEAKLSELVSSKLSSLGVARASYTFLIVPAIKSLAQLTLEKLQRAYVITSWDRTNGAEIELPNELKLSVFAEDDRIRITIETHYAFEFQRRAKEFSVRDFAAWLVGPRSEAPSNKALQRSGRKAPRR